MLRVMAMPSSGIDATKFITAIGRRKFALIVDIGMERTYLYLEGEIEAARLLRAAMPGLELEAAAPISASNVDIVSTYKLPEERHNILSDVAARLDKGLFGAFFVPCSEEDIGKSKSAVEHMLGSRAVKATRSSYGGILGRGSNVSMHVDLFDESEERQMLLSVLEDMDFTLLSGKPLFKVSVALFDDAGAARNALGEASVIMGSSRIPFDGIDGLFSAVAARNSLALGIRHTVGFIGLVGAERLNYVVETFFGDKGCDNPVKLGTYAKNGTLETGKDVVMPRSSLNLGMIISGLPGSGKTREAMAVAHSAINAEERPNVVIVSPTSEWNAFATEHGMHLIRLSEDNMQINFFSSPNGTRKGKFYEDLAMLISSASNSGPYRNPMEKCLLNAFKTCLNDGIDGPTHIYDQIEESIIRFHGKRTNAGVRYTKHGENIRASLENLRQILSDRRYSATSGIPFMKLAQRGVVFDLANISNSAKPYFYALLLTQFYAIADMFDDAGDDELRMLICVEEAQTIFSSDKESAATLDLINRIQDFRKKGIGIMLLAHSITDISPEIRRMCQNKLYLKQAPDVAAIAAKDLVFTLADPDDVVSKLKHLDSRIAAANFMSKSNGEKISHDSIFLRTCNYDMKPLRAGHHTAMRRAERTSAMDVHIKDESGEKAGKAAALSVSFMGESVCEKPVIDGMCTIDVLKGRLYRLSLLSGYGRVLGSFKVTAAPSVTLVTKESGVEVRYV